MVTPDSPADMIGTYLKRCKELKIQPRLHDDLKKLLVVSATSTNPTPPPPPRKPRAPKQVMFDQQVAVATPSYERIFVLSHTLNQTDGVVASVPVGFAPKLTTFTDPEQQPIRQPPKVEEPSVPVTVELLYPEDKDLIEQVRRRRNRRTKPTAINVCSCNFANTDI